MPGGSRPDRRPLTRADLPDEFTPETVRRLDVFTVRRLSQPGNGILTADEQRSFDEALRSVMQDTTDRLDQSLRRVRRGGPGGLDPQLRRSYARTEERLAAQARRARQSFPQLTDDWDAAGRAAGRAGDDRRARRRDLARCAGVGDRADVGHAGDPRTDRLDPAAAARAPTDPGAARCPWRVLRPARVGRRHRRRRGPARPGRRPTSDG